MYQCRVVTNLIENLKSYKSIIQENASDQKVLFENVNKSPQKKIVQETHRKPFCRFFSKKRFLTYIRA